MGQLGNFLFNNTTADIRYYGVDLLFKYKGFSFESELYNRTSNRGVIVNNLDTNMSNFVISGTALLFQTGYFVSDRNEIALRYAQITPQQNLQSVMNMQREYVVGFSHYFNNHNLKIQTDVTFLENSVRNTIIYRLSAVCRF